MNSSPEGNVSIVGQFLTNPCFLYIELVISGAARGFRSHLRTVLCFKIHSILSASPIFFPQVKYPGLLDCWIPRRFADSSECASAALHSFLYAAIIPGKETDPSGHIAETFLIPVTVTHFDSHIIADC